MKRLLMVFMVVVTACPACTSTTGTPTTTSQLITSVPAATGSFAIDIVAPVDLSQVEAEFDRDTGGFAAVVELEAEVRNAEGPVSVHWDSTIEGDLGSGLAIDAVLRVPEGDSALHVLTVTATDAADEIARDRIRVIVVVPSPG